MTSILFVGLQSVKLLAQTQVSIGFKAGSNFAQWQYSEPSSSVQKSAIGLTASVPVEFQFNQLLGLQTELGFIQKGERSEFGNGSYSSRVTLNFIELPVVGRLSFGKGLKMVISFGPFGGFALNGKVKYSGSNTPGQSVGIDFEKDDVSRVDAGLLMGLGIKGPVANGYFTLDVRYAYGLIDVSTESQNSFQVHNKGLNMMVGFLIPVNKKKASTTTENKTL